MIIFTRTRRRLNMERVARRGWKPFAILVAAAALYWLAMFAATHLPFQTTPQGDPYSLDKLEHITAFAIFAVLLCTAGTFTPLGRIALYCAVFAFIAAYAAIDELSQRFVPERTPDIQDWLADLIGAALGIAIFAVGHRLYLNRQARAASLSEPTA